MPEQFQRLEWLGVRVESLYHREDEHEEPQDAATIFFRTKIPGRDPLLAEAHRPRQTVDLSFDELQEPWMLAVRPECRFAFAKRHQVLPLLFEKQVFGHACRILRFRRLS